MPVFVLGGLGIAAIWWIVIIFSLYVYISSYETNFSSVWRKWISWITSCTPPTTYCMLIVLYLSIQSLVSPRGLHLVSNESQSIYDVWRKLPFQVQQSILTLRHSWEIMCALALLNTSTSVTPSCLNFLNKTQLRSHVGDNYSSCSENQNKRRSLICKYVST